MAAYDVLLRLVGNYFTSLGYNNDYVSGYFSPEVFKEIAVICLANANVMIKNKTDHTSHQTHIAITGEMIDFFCPYSEFSELDNETINHTNVVISHANLVELSRRTESLSDSMSIEVIHGSFSWGKRTQNQLQLSKRNTLNSDCFNSLRLGLYENDLLIMLKFRKIPDVVMAVGICQRFYKKEIPRFSELFETNTYLRIPYRK